jgi:hypothetical protein
MRGLKLRLAQATTENAIDTEKDESMEKEEELQRPTSSSVRGRQQLPKIVNYPAPSRRRHKKRGRRRVYFLFYKL